MNYQESHDFFKVLYDELDSLSLPSIDPEVVDMMINLGVDRFVDRVYDSYLENKEKGLVELQTLITPFSITTFTLVRNDFEKEYSCDLPVDFLYNLEESMYCTIICNDKAIKKKVEVVDRKNSTASNNHKNPFKKANSNKVLRTILQNKYKIITDLETTPNELTGVYLKIPRRIDYYNQIDLDLPEKSIKKAIQEAVNITLEIVQSGRFQTQNIINKTN